MKNALLILICFCAPLSTLAVDGPFAGVTVGADGVIRPQGFVAANSNLVAVATGNQVMGAVADATLASTTLLTERLAVVEQAILQREMVGYIRDYARNYGYGLAPNTNMIASIVRIEKAGDDGENAFIRLFTHYSKDPGLLAVHAVKYVSSLGGTNVWDYAPVVSQTLTNVLIGATSWECYAYVASVPLAYKSAFLKTYCDSSSIIGSGLMPIRNGVQVNGKAGITKTFRSGTNTVEITGGAWTGTRATP